MRATALVITLCISWMCTYAQDSDFQALVDQGNTALKTNHYTDAVEAFQKAIQLQPSNTAAHLALASAYEIQWVPGDESEQNQQNLSNALTEYSRAVQLDPVNKRAISALAYLSYKQASSSKDDGTRLQKLDASAAYFRKLAEIDSGSKEADYMQGVIAWSKWYGPYSQARRNFGMQPSDPGPFHDPEVQQDLLNRFGQTVDGGVENLKKAIEIDPECSDCMTYLNLLIRERADLRGNTFEYQQDLAEADIWSKRALETRRKQAASGTFGGVVPMRPAISPHDPVPPGLVPGSVPPARSAFHGVRLSRDVAEANLISKVDPVYPSLAKAAKVQGAVEFTAQIGKNGKITNLQLVRGHPLLVNAAREAILQS
ncbi:MAG: tetratricopeptide repeat protein, partial [Acidobacteriia bacterium]|nr:tetratricopeptide repeat protein [Terriglobia bacterium]